MILALMAGFGFFSNLLSSTHSLSFIRFTCSCFAFKLPVSSHWCKIIRAKSFLANCEFLITWCWLISVPGLLSFGFQKAFILCYLTCFWTLDLSSHPVLVIPSAPLRTSEVLAWKSVPASTLPLDNPSEFFCSASLLELWNTSYGETSLRTSLPPLGSSLFWSH